METLGAKGVGKAFFVYKWGDIDLALPRQEHKIGPGHQGFEVRVCQEEKEASKRRDFTVNAMMISLFDETLLDFWDGRTDAASRILRHIDSDLFAQDPLRVLRGVQFAARFGFKIAAETIQIMQALPLEELSKTRISWELEKLFLGEYYAHGLLAMYQLGLFEKLLHVKPSWKAVAKLSRTLLRNKPYVLPELKPYFWLFFTLNMLNLDKEKTLRALGLPKHYHAHIVNVPFGNASMSDAALAKVALDRPLASWAGSCRKGVQERANKMGIFETPFDTGVDPMQVMREGFCGRDIGKELRRRASEKICQLYPKKN
jgi:tRNA nucleotidyltransferase (CCA-adding enzyme)